MTTPEDTKCMRLFLSGSAAELAGNGEYNATCLLRTWHLFRGWTGAGFTPSFGKVSGVYLWAVQGSGVLAIDARKWHT